MSSYKRSSRPPPNFSSIADSQHSSKDASHFPSGYRLIVTTTRGVYAWDQTGITEMFRSGSEGIVAAKLITDPERMLAVADNHVVILHDVDKGMQRSYRLKGSEGQVRLLKYASTLSKNLFFTTSLRNSIQSYSLQDSTVPGPTYAHPSPPSVFAISCTSQLLVSTSSNPPTIYLSDLTSNEPPILIQPQCTSSAVVAADFHPESSTIFALAFADGTVAVYNAFHIHQDPQHHHEIRVAEIGYIKKLHAIGSTGLGSEVLDTAQQGAIHFDTVIQPAGISGVALVPCHKALVVTVGMDGKCCVVDFTQPTKTRALLLQTWHVRRPATSLSVVHHASNDLRPQLDGTSDRRGPPNHDYCIAVGRQDGKVLLFDLGGKALGQTTLDPSRARIVDVEWAKREIDAALSQQPRKSIVRDVVIGHNGLSNADANVLQNSTKADGNSADIDRDKTTTCREAPKIYHNMSFNQHVVASGSSGPHSVPDSALEGSVTRPARPSPKEDDSGRNSNDVLRASEHEEARDVARMKNGVNIEKPPVPPRPTPRAGGRLSMRRAQTTRERKDSPLAESPPESLQRAATLKTSPFLRRHDDNPAPRVMRKPVGPRQFPPDQDWKSQPRPRANYVQADAIEPLTHFQQMNMEQVSRRSLSKENQRMITVGAEQQPVPTASSLDSFRTASTHISVPSASDVSDDTVVDWSTAASSRRPEPSPTSIALPEPVSYFQERPVQSQQSQPVDKHPDQSMLTDRSKKEGHESISFFSSSGASSSIMTDKPHSRSPSLSTAHARHERQHAGMNSRDLNMGDIIQWPSFKKSPRVSDLASGIESATASILDLGIYSQTEGDSHGNATSGDESMEGTKEETSHLPKLDAADDRLPVLPRVPPPLPPRDKSVTNSEHAAVGEDTDTGLSYTHSSIPAEPPLQDAPIAPAHTLSEAEEDRHSCDCTSQLMQALHTEMGRVRDEVRTDLREQRDLIVGMLERFDRVVVSMKGV